MDREIVIEPLNNKDCGSIISLVLPIQQIEFGIPVTLEGQPDLLDIELYYFRDGGRFWGAKHNGQLVGTIALINIGYNTGVLRKMFVQKEFRGKQFGVGQQLLTTLTAYCRAHNINHLYLGTVEVMKAAHRFYERNGFSRISVDMLPSYFQRMPSDNVFYYLNLHN